jgi:hypothetical protein
MALQKYSIELRTDHDDPSKDATIVEAMKVAAKHIFTTALLIQDRRKPTIAMETGDMFVGEVEINLADDLPAIPPSLDAMPEAGAPEPVVDPNANQTVDVSFGQEVAPTDLPAPCECRVCGKATPAADMLCEECEAARA